MWQRYTGHVSRDLHAKLGDRPAWHQGAWYAINNANHVMVHPPEQGTLGRALAPTSHAHGVPGHMAGGRAGHGLPALMTRGHGYDRGLGVTAIERSLGALPNGAIAVAQNTDNSGQLNIRSAPGTSNPVVGGIPNGGLFYITGAPVDTSGNTWAPGGDPTNDMPNASPDQNAWYPAATADFSVTGFVATGPGTSGERLTTITNQTDPIVPAPVPPPAPAPAPPPPPAPAPGPSQPAAASTSNTGMLALAAVVVVGGGAAAYWYMKKHKRH